MGREAELGVRSREVLRSSAFFGRKKTFLKDMHSLAITSKAILLFPIKVHCTDEAGRWAIFARFDYF